MPKKNDKFRTTTTVGFTGLTYIGIFNSLKELNQRFKRQNTEGCCAIIAGDVWYNDSGSWRKRAPITIETSTHNWDSNPCNEIYLDSESLMGSMTTVTISSGDYLNV